MSVRSFDKIVRSPDPEKLSVILQRVRDSMASTRHHTYICLTARYIYDEDELATPAQIEATKERVSTFLAANGVGLGGDWFSEIYAQARPLWDDSAYRPENASSVAQRTARLAVLDVLIHQLLQRGE